MSQFNTTKFKLQKMWNSAFGLSDEIDFQTVINSQIQSNLEDLQLKGGELKNIIKLESDWIDLQVGTINTNNIITSKYQNIIFTFKNIPINFKGIIKPSIIYKFGLNGDVPTTFGVNNTKSFNYLLQKISYTTVQDIILTASYAIVDNTGNIPDNFQIKLLININPYLYTT